MAIDQPNVTRYITKLRKKIPKAFATEIFDFKNISFFYSFFEDIHFLSFLFEIIRKSGRRFEILALEKSTRFIDLVIAISKNT